MLTQKINKKNKYFGDKKVNFKYKKGTRVRKTKF